MVHPRKSVEKKKKQIIQKQPSTGTDIMVTFFLLRKLKKKTNFNLKTFLFKTCPTSKLKKQVPILSLSYGVVFYRTTNQSRTKEVSSCVPIGPLGSKCYEPRHS